MGRRIGAEVELVRLQTSLSVWDWFRAVGRMGNNLWVNADGYERKALYAMQVNTAV